MALAALYTPSPVYVRCTVCTVHISATGAEKWQIRRAYLTVANDKFRLPYRREVNMNDMSALLEELLLTTSNEESKFRRVDGFAVYTIPASILLIHEIP